jgi:hypothetical protein
MNMMIVIELVFTFFKVPIDFSGMQHWIYLFYDCLNFLSGLSVKVIEYLKDTMSVE